MHEAKTIRELPTFDSDYVVTVSSHAHESCPFFSGKAKIIHVGFDAPPKLSKSAIAEEEALSHYRRVRDEIKSIVEALPLSLSEKK